MLVMTNYEIVDRRGWTHCAPMVGHLTPVKVTCMLISTHTILHFVWSMVGTLLLLLLLIRPGSNRVGFNLKALWNAFWDDVIPLREEWLRGYTQVTQFEVSVSLLIFQTNCKLLWQNRRYIYDRGWMCNFWLVDLWDTTRGHMGCSVSSTLPVCVNVNSMSRHTFLHYLLVIGVVRFLQVDFVAQFKTSQIPC